MGLVWSSRIRISVFMTLLATLICRHRLSWFGKVKRPSCEISRVRSMSIDAKKGFDRPRKTSWCICISEYLKLLSSLNCMMPRTDWDGDHMWRTVNWSLSKNVGTYPWVWLVQLHERSNVFFNWYRPLQIQTITNKYISSLSLKLSKMSC